MARESCINGQGEEIVTFAKEELEHYLALAGDSFQPPRIVVDKEYAKQCFPDEINGLKPDGFVIGKKNGEVMIGAINDRGLLYGVYEYIEHAVGIRFVDAPYGEVDTELRDPEWPAETILENPTFTYRGGNMHMARSDENFCYNVDRLPKFRFNNVLLFSQQLDLLKRYIGEFRKRGVCVTLGGHCWPYLFRNRGKVSPEAFMREHPEWHALVDGKRMMCEDSEGHFCLSNEEAVTNFVNNALSMIEDYKECIDIISLWPNDTDALFCECENCAKHRNSDLVLRLINRVADEVAVRYPYMQVEMLAYEDFTAPPEHTVPSPNVLVNFAAIQRDYRLPIYSAERRNIALFRDLRGWRALRKDLPMIVYEYYRLDGTTKSSVIEYELERLQEEGLVGLMEDTFQINKPDDVQEAIGFMTYLESKLLWNLEQSADSLQRELVEAMFKEQSPVVLRALHRLEQIHSGRVFYDLTWHDWRLRPIHNVQVQEERLAFITGELTNLRDLISEAAQKSEGAVRDRLSMMLASLERQYQFMAAIEYQIKAQLVFLTDGPQEEADEWLRRALEVRGLKASALSQDAIQPYCKAYGELPESSVRMLIPMDRKDRVGRIAIMEKCEHICKRILASGECMRCTMPVCIKAVRNTPLREYI